MEDILNKTLKNLSLHLAFAFPLQIYDFQIAWLKVKKSELITSKRCNPTLSGRSVSIFKVFE